MASTGWIGDLVVGAHFLARLPGFLRRPVGVAEADAVLRRRLADRERDFLTLIRRGVYQHSGSPYRELLRLAGCEFGDVEQLVGTEGVEGALGVLYRHGVCLTVEELKGRRPLVRGRTTIAAHPDRFRNPASAGHFAVQTSGSRGARAPVPLDLDFLAELAVNRVLALAARGGRDWRVAHWDVPGGGLGAILVYAKAGTAPVRWFSPVAPELPGVHPRYRWSARVARWGSLLAERPLPVPRHAPVDDPLPIARWMADVHRAETGDDPARGRHLFHDFHALIQPGPDGTRPGLPAGALLLTSIRPTVPLILLNVSMGDQAVVSARACGCPLERLGWTTHLHTIRSYEKLTAGGMTFLDTDVIRVLEQVLPARFERIMGMVWRDADLLRVERRPPLTTASGKILHLHLEGARAAREAVD